MILINLNILFALDAATSKYRTFVFSLTMFLNDAMCVYTTNVFRAKDDRPLGERNEDV